MLFLLTVALVVALVYVVKRYNALQLLAQGVHEARANIVASMKKRLDLCNGLVDVARQYASDETLMHVSIANGDREAALLSSERSVTSTISYVSQLAGRFPELKASAMYQQYMAELAACEHNLQEKREQFNAQVRTYNGQLTQLPTSLFAASLGFRQAEYFNVESADSLESLRGFSDDGTMVRDLLKQGLQTSMESGRRVAAESARIGRTVVERGRELQAARAVAEPRQPAVYEIGSGTGHGPTGRPALGDGGANGSAPPPPAS